MSVKVIAHQVPALDPFAVNPAEYRIAGDTVSQWIIKRFPVAVSREIWVRADFYPSAALAARLFGGICANVLDPVTGEELACAGDDSASDRCTLFPDEDSLILRGPLDLLALGERLVDSVKEQTVSGNVSDSAVIRGSVRIGEGSDIPEGVYIDGNVIIGKNCVLAPHCRICGKTVIGDGCVIGDSVEISNCVIGDHAEIQPGCCVRDSILGSGVVIGAGFETTGTGKRTISGAVVIKSEKE